MGCRQGAENVIAMEKRFLGVGHNLDVEGRPGQDLAVP